MEKIITIDRLAFGGEGVGRDTGKVVFVPWTVPGDRVRVRIISDHGRYERGELLEVMEGSTERVLPPCPVFSVCGGCQWQNVKYEAQLRWKGEILRETLERVGQIGSPKILPIVQSMHPWNYRRRIQLKLDAQGQIGFYRAKSHEVVPFEECHIANPLLNEKLREVRSNGERPQTAFEISLNGKPAAEIHETLQPSHHDEDRVFLQVNPEQNQALIQTVLDFAFGNAEPAFSKRKRVVELYSGSGNLTFPLAERVGEVTAVEENAEAVRKAEAEAVSSGISNIEWITGTAEWGLKGIYRKKEQVDLLVLDPPRRGAKEILDLIPLIRPRMMIYVSCDPVTLARDLNLLLRRHFRLEKIQPIDMFPQTYHIESVSQLALL